MINSINLFRFINKKIRFFSGVPDSNLKYLINLFDNKNIDHHICANEGLATAMGIGYYLSTKKIPAVYMQNSGLSNALNPLLSIAHSKVYSIPLFLIIGWRGSPGSKDEPQHLVKGNITRTLLKLSGVKVEIINHDYDFKKIEKLIKFAKLKKSPVAILIKNGALTKTKNRIQKKNVTNLFREDVINELIKQVRKKTYIISNTGFASRELDHCLKMHKNKYIRPFYMIGGMGHTSMVAISQAIYKKKYDIICIDGDGSLIMHFGSIINTGYLKPNNFKHLLINNLQHESVGGQPSNVDKVSFIKFAKISGYKNIFFCREKSNLNRKIKKFLSQKQVSFMEVQTSPKTSSNLGRPKNFKKIKDKFMK